MATKVTTPPGPKRSPKAVAKAIGREYVESDRLPKENTRETERVYSDIADVIESLYDEIPVPVVFQEQDPYDDYEDMARTVGQEQQLRIYNQHTDHRYFSHDEQLKFRAVHDWHGHLSADENFTPAGEYRKYYHMQRYFYPAAQRVMFAEIVGQVGAVHYLQDGFADDRYEQRAFMAPYHWMRWMAEACF